MISEEELKELILVTVDCLVSGFLYYDRKEDEELPRGSIESAVMSGVISPEEIIERFSEGIERNLTFG